MIMPQEKLTVVTLVAGLNERYVAQQALHFQTVPDYETDERRRAYKAAAFSVSNASVLLLRPLYIAVGIAPPEINPFTDQVSTRRQTNVPETLPDHVLTAGEKLFALFDATIAEARVYADAVAAAEAKSIDPQPDELPPLVASPDDFSRRLAELQELVDGLKQRNEHTQQRLERQAESSEPRVEEARIFARALADLTIGVGEDLQLARGEDTTKDPETRDRLRADLNELQTLLPEGQKIEGLDGGDVEEGDADPVDFIADWAGQDCAIGTQGSKEGFLVSGKHEYDLGIKVFNLIVVVLRPTDVDDRYGPNNPCWPGMGPGGQPIEQAPETPENK